MQVTGKSIVITALAVALVMSVGAWWYHYSASRRAAQFWGPDATRLLIGKGEVAFFTLGSLRDESDAPSAGNVVAGREVVAEQSLTDKPGLIHLRHALTQDASFDWAGRREASHSDEWAYALRFGEEPQRLDILWSRDFTTLGVVDVGANVEVLPCPRLAPAVQAYLRDVGVLPPRGSISPKSTATFEESRPQAR